MPIAANRVDDLLNRGLTSQNLHFSLHTGAPPVRTNEVSGGGYARIIAGDGSRQFSPMIEGGEARLVFPAQDAAFPQATGAWSTVACIALSDGSVAGALSTYFAWSEISPAIEVRTGDTVRIRAGDAHISFSGQWTNASLVSAVGSTSLGGRSPNVLTYYVGLHTGTPATVANELTGRGYARVQVRFPAGFSQIDSDGRKSTPAAAIQFPSVTGGVAWTKPSHFGLWADLAGGAAPVAYGALTTPVPTPPSAGHYRIPPGGLRVQFS